MPATTKEASGTGTSRELTRENDYSIDRVNEKSFGRTVEMDPKAHAWLTISAGAVVPLGLAGAAVATTYVSNNEKVSMTAWIAVAIVGTASVISAASVSRRRSVAVGGDNWGAREANRDAELTRHKAR